MDAFFAHHSHTRRSSTSYFLAAEQLPHISASLITFSWNERGKEQSFLPLREDASMSSCIADAMILREGFSDTCHPVK